MKHAVLRFGLAAGIAGALLVDASAQDAVTVETKTVYGNTSVCSIGVFVSNVTPLRGMVIPLEIRTATHGAYIAPAAVANDFAWGIVAGNRVWASPLGVAMPGWPASGSTVRKFADTAEFFSACSGPVSHTFHTGANKPDFLSPDAVFDSRVSTGDENIGEQVTLPPGSDPAGSASASFLIRTGIAPQYGTFVVDTCCVTPGSHLNFVDVNTASVQPAFTAGVITVRCHHADPSCDGAHDILDVVLVANRAYRAAEASNDPSCGAHGTNVDGLTDVNCDGVTDIVDHVSMVNVAFRGADASTTFCNPCP